MDDRLTSTKAISPEQTPTGNQRELMEVLRRIDTKTNSLHGHMFGVGRGEDPEAPQYIPENWSQLTHENLVLARGIENSLTNLLDRL